MRRSLLFLLMSMLIAFTSQAQRVVGYLPSYRDPNNAAIKYDCLTDICFSFINFNTDGTLITGNPSDQVFGFDMTRFSTVKTKCKPQSPSGPNLWISVGGADNSSARKGRFTAVCSNSGTRATLVSQLVNFCNTHGLAGIDIDWEFPANTTADKLAHQNLMADLRTAINTYNTNNPTKPLKLSMAVGGETNASLSANGGHLAFCNPATISSIDYLHIMSYDLPASYGSDHTVPSRCYEGVTNWQAFGGSSNAPWSKMNVGIAFYGRPDPRGADLTRNYSDETGANAQTIFNSTTDAAVNSYYYDSKKNSEDKVSWIMQKGGAGVIIWDVGQDRTDYSLTSAICSKMILECLAPQPNLGTDIGVCMPGTISLNSNVTTGTGRTFSWKENGVTMSGQSNPTLSKSTSGMTAGTYLYEVIVTYNGGCSRSSTVKVVLANPVTANGATICGPGTANLAVTSTGSTYEWYDAVSAGNKLFTGANFTTPSITTTTDYWVQAATGSSTSYIGKTQVEGIANPPGWALNAPGDNGAGRPNYAQKLVLTQSATIQSVTVFGNSLPYANARVVVFSSADGTTMVAQSAATTISTSPFSFPVNITLPSGTYFVGLLVPGVSGWSGPILDITGTQGTFSVSGVGTLDKNCYNGNFVGTGAEQTGYYGQMYNWVVTTGVVNPCARTKVTATVSTGASAALAVTGSKVCSGTNGSVLVTAAESGISYQAFIGATAVGTAANGAGANLTLTIPSASLSAGNNIISVKGTKTGCGTTTLTDTAWVTVNTVPGTPGTITATTPICTGTSQTVSVAAVPTATSYTWSYTTGTGVTFGGTTASVTATIAAGATSGTINVVAVNTCGSSASAATKALVVNSPAAQPSVITGPANVTAGQSGVSYSVTNVPGVTYTWNYNGTNVTPVSGQGTSTIVLDFASGATGGTLTVSATNPPCAPSIVRDLVITVGAAAVDPTQAYAAVSKTYGDATFSMLASSNSSGAFTYSITPASAVATITSAGVVTITGAGTVNITASQAAAAGYNAKTITGTLTVAKKGLTVTADNKTKVFNAANPALTVSYSGFAYSDNQASLTTQATATTTAVTNSPAGPYPITAGGAVSNNYTFNYVAGTLTVTPIAPTITFANVNKVYGDASFSMTATSNSSGAITYAVTNGSGATITSAGVVTITGAGTVEITATQVANGSYSGGTITANLIIAKKGLTVTADNKTKALNAVNPPLTVSYAGFAYSDNAGSLTTQATATTTAVTNSPAGSYPITAGGAVSANYTFTYVAGTLTVNPASAPTIAFANVNKVYGDASFSMTATSNSSGAITYAVTNGSGATITSAGLVTITGAGTVEITATQVANGSYSGGTITANLIIAKKGLTVTADNKTKALNAVNPPLTVSYAGFAYSDNAGSLTTQATATTTAVTNSPAGSYPITAGGAVSANYTFTYVAGTLTVNAAGAPTIAFANVNKVYGDASFSMTATSNSSGAITYAVTNGSGATITSAGVVTITGAGTVEITATQVADGPYSGGSLTANLTIAKKGLTVTADNKTKALNAVNPPLTVSYAGFAYSDNAGSLTTQATATTTAVTNSPAGPYPITAGGAVSANYTFNYVAGTLTVNAASSPTIAFANVNKVYGDASFSMTATSNSSGAITYAVTNGSGATITSAGVVTITGAGTVEITATQVADGPYSGGSLTANLTIAKKGLTVTADNKTKALNAVNPPLTVSYAGFAYSDNAGSLTTQATATTTAVTNSPAGSYPITAGGAVSANYTFIYVAGTLTVNAAGAPTIAFANVNKVYGDASFSMTATSNSSGAITYAVTNGSGATITSAGVVTITGAGTVEITATQVADGPYSGGSLTANLTIAKKGLTVTADNKTKALNAVNPPLTVSYAGFAYSDNAGSLTTQATATTTAVTNSPAGSYPITAGGAVSANYTFTYVAGTLTINSASSPTISLSSSINKTYGDVAFNVPVTSNSSGAYTYSITSGNAFATIDPSTGLVTITGAGTVTIKVDQAADGTFGAGTASTTLTIAKANPVLTITSASSGQTGTTITLSSSSTSPATVTYAVANGSGTATITGGTTLNLGSTGTVTVTASQVATANYNSATSTPQVVTISGTGVNQPGNFVISSTTVYQGQKGVVYEVPNDPNVDFYVWTYTTGTGVTTTSTGYKASFDVSCTASSGKVSVAASKNGVQSLPREINVTVIPGAESPSAITGPIVVEKGKTVTYSVTNVANLNYTWSYSGSNADIVKAGNGSSVTITYQFGATEGDLTVGSYNQVCGKFGAQVSTIKIKLTEPTTAIGDVVLEGISLKVYPNPYVESSKVELNIANDQKVQLVVFDLTGNVVGQLESADLPAGEHSYIMPELPNGVYIIRAVVGDKVLTTKVIRAQ